MNVSKEQIAPGIVFAGHADVLGSLQSGMVGLSY
jgi:hypothetical protein